MNPIKIKDIEQNKKNFISKTIDNFCYRLGGEEKIFVLDTKTFSFVIIKPSMFNIGYHIFNSLKDFYLFKIFFKHIIRIPHFFLETYTGSFFFYISIIWAFIGREPITTIFCLVFITEFLGFTCFLMYFFRIDDTYQYCIDTYGKAFVEKYIGNPLSTIQKATIKILVIAVTAVTSDQVDRHICHKHMEMEIERNIKHCQENNIPIGVNDIVKFNEMAKANNIPRGDSITKLVEYISTPWGGIKRK